MSDYQIILSYSKEDKKLADKFLSDILLMSFGLNANNIFHEGIGFDGFDDSIRSTQAYRKLVSEAKLFIALVTPNYLNNPSCLMDLGAAWGQFGTLVDKSNSNPVVCMVPDKQVPSLDGWFAGSQAFPLGTYKGLVALYKKLSVKLGISSDESRRGEKINEFAAYFKGGPAKEFEAMVGQKGDGLSDPLEEHAQRIGYYRITETGPKSQDSYMSHVGFENDSQSDAKILFSNFYNINKYNVTELVVGHVKSNHIYIPLQKVQKLKFKGSGIILEDGTFEIFFSVIMGNEIENNYAEFRKQ